MNLEPLMTAAARTNRRRGIALLAVMSLGLGGSLLASPASAQSLSDRFKSLFGGNSEPAPGTAAAPAEEADSDLSCPPVTIRAGASTYAVAAPGKQAVGSDLRYQASITKTARECTVNSGQITGRIGIQGRVIAGPAGAPATVTVPMRVAVVQTGVQEKTIATKAFQTTVTMAEDGSVPFTLIAEDVTYPAPRGDVSDSYVFYIGFDPQALKPEPKPKAPKKK